MSPAVVAAAPAPRGASPQRPCSPGLGARPHCPEAAMTGPGSPLPARPEPPQRRPQLFNPAAILGGGFPACTALRPPSPPGGLTGGRGHPLDPAHTDRQAPPTPAGPTPLWARPRPLASPLSVATPIAAACRPVVAAEPFTGAQPGPDRGLAGDGAAPFPASSRGGGEPGLDAALGPGARRRRWRKRSRACAERSVSLAPAPRQVALPLRRPALASRAGAALHSAMAAAAAGSRADGPGGGCRKAPGMRSWIPALGSPLR
ncbi:uncharacterized protein LOC142361108 [Opisthocomus hoazin]|uniref:uncharacterized protein LOC142361108 n=1 Tax=Opisthocomus hoazin TaxID=30419 RepID=UPI003F535132